LKFTREKSSNFLQTKDSAGEVLKIINVDLYNYLNAHFINGDNTILISLLIDLGDWIKNFIGPNYINIAYVVLGLVIFIKDIGDIVNFFKPYHARMKSLELIDINNKLTESIRLDDNLKNVDSIDPIVDYCTADGDLLDSTSLINCGNLICPDSTSSFCWGYRRDTYDCGSYYDIGVCWDNEIIICEDLILDGVYCLPDGTAAIDYGYTLMDSTSFDSTEISTVWVSSGFCDFDEEGVFDCITGADVCQISVEEI